MRDLDQGAWTSHSERPSRAEAIADRAGTLLEARDFGLAPIEAVHTPDYVDFLRSAHDDWLAAGRTGETIPVSWPVVHRRSIELDKVDARVGRYSTDLITPIMEGTWAAAYGSAQAALSGMELLLQGRSRAVFALCRPPGHHAGRDYCGGYCYLNNAAIAGRRATAAGKRVAILDIDCHHGNGTQDIFYDTDDVLFVSIHADPSTTYPYFWGRPDERGSGRGEGFNLNLPLPKGTGADIYLRTLETALQAIDVYRPEVLIVSFGADTFVHDPFSDFRLTTEDYLEMSSRIAGLGRPALVVMEGGYAVDDLGQNVAAFLSRF